MKRMKSTPANERGIALVLSLFLMMALSVVGASLMFLSQTETYSSMNYRMMSQARYGAEAGIEVAANYLMYTANYAPPGSTNPGDPITGVYNTNVSPVTLVANNNPVVLSTVAANSNYPVAAVETAYQNFVAGFGALAAGSTSITYAPTATLMSMEEIPAAVSVTGNAFTIQTWRITADGNINPGGTRNAQVEVTAVVETQKISSTSPSLNYAAFAQSGGCGAITMKGGASTQSYDSSTYTGGTLTLNSSNGNLQNSGGNVGTNGNLTDSGGTTINGTLSTPRVGVGNCSNGNVDANTSNGGASTQGIVHLPSSVTPATPNIPTPNLGSPASTTLSITSASKCTDAQFLINLPPGVICTTITPGNISLSGNGTLDNISVGSGATLTMNSGNYTLGTVSVSGGTMNFTGGANDVVNMTSLSTTGNSSAVSLGTGTYNTNSISTAGNSSTITIPQNATDTLNVVQSVTLGSQTSLNLAGTGANEGTLNLNIVNTPGVTTPLDLSGGAVNNPSLNPGNLIIQYGGTGNIKMAGGGSQAAVVYAPNASASFSGSTALYGELIANTVSDTGGAEIYYDRNLQKKGLFQQTLFQSGNPMLSSFSWKKQ